MISVIMPVYNGACYLGAALASVFAQSYQPLEVIVVDDGSTDESAAVVAQLQSDRASESAQRGTMLRYVYQANAGPAAARNRGVALTNGALLAFLDADDWWHPEKLARQVALLNQQPDLGYVVSHMSVQLEANTTWPVSLNQAHYQNQPRCLLPSALVVHRQTFYQVGGFDESYRYSDDADWFLRAKDRGVSFAVAPEPLVYKRIHATNLSHTPAMSQETLRAFHASIQRQRQAQTLATGNAQ
ncbi:MAG: glycosyltransferase family A protein [Caldilineaceae bacterium]